MNRRKGYNVKYTFNNGFVDLLEDIWRRKGDEVFKINGIASSHLDVALFGKEFFGTEKAVADMSVDANGNVNNGKDIIQYDSERHKASSKLNGLYLIYKWVKKTYDEASANKAVEYILDGTIFVNDMTGIEKPYCYAFDLRKLISNGMDFFNGPFEIKSPKHSFTFINVFIQTLSYISNSITGAAAFPDFFPILDWYYRNEFGEDYIKNLDGQTKKEIKQQFQNLTYSLNFPFRGNQSPFTNLSVMDRGFLENLFDGYVFPDLTEVNIESTLELSKMYSEYYDELNGKHGYFTFPVLTHALSVNEKNEFKDIETVEWSARTNNEKMLSNIFISPPSAFSSCCRLINRYKDKEYQNSFGVGGLSIGSHRVAGINLPRLAFSGNLDEILDIVHKVLHSHRLLIEDKIKKGFFPLYSKGWIDLERQNSTIGLIGANEYVENLGKDIKTEEGIKEALKVYDKINDYAEYWTDRYNGTRWNIEGIPGETVAVRLAKLDNHLNFNKNNYKMYSNQYIPLIEDISYIDRLKIQGKFDQKTSGGAIAHITHLSEIPPSSKQMFHIMDTARRNGTVYFAINAIMNKCENGHYFNGKVEECPVCKTRNIDSYTRVVGFLTPVKYWNPTRRDWEYDKRTDNDINN